jgi:8-oxo-dGTP diphosphatase
VAVDEIFEVTHHRYPQRAVLLLFYKCRWLGGDVQHLQVADHAWVLPEELEQYELPPADGPVARRLEARAGDTLDNAHEVDPDAVIASLSKVR